MSLGKDTARSVLLVDDEEIVLEVGETLLTRAGYPVILAEGGKTAVAMYQQYKEDILCVFLDLSMPGMNGQETFKELEGLDPEVKVFFTSGFSEREMAHQCAGIPAAGFIQKPFKLGDIAAKIEALKKGT
jgi:DNA-binding NtrC family response regulator